MPEVKYDEPLVANWTDEQLAQIRAIKAREYSLSRRERKRLDERRLRAMRPRLIRNEAIRLLYSTGCFTYRDLADMMGVSVVTVSVLFCRDRKPAGRAKLGGV